jgi:hypothetical protein
VDDLEATLGSHLAEMKSWVSGCWSTVETRM